MVSQVEETKLQTSTLKLHSYPSKPFDVLGSCSVKVTIHVKTATLPQVVVKGDGISLLDRNWLEEIKLDWNEVAKINGITRPLHHEKLDDLLKQYEDIFRMSWGSVSR